MKKVFLLLLWSSLGFCADQIVTTNGSVSGGLKVSTLTGILEVTSGVPAAASETGTGSIVRSISPTLTGTALASNLTLSGREIISGNGAVSAPPWSITGTWFSGGTGTTTKPQAHIECTGATSTGWHTGGTGLGINACSGFSGYLVDALVNNSRKFNVDSTGSFVAAGGGQLSGTLTLGAGNAILWTSTSIIETNSVSGDIRMSNSGRTDFGLLRFGQSASTFPALKRSGARLIARLGDDSATGLFEAAAVVRGGAVATTNAACSASAITGGASGGKFTVGAGVCAGIVITPGFTAPNGWHCKVNNLTTPANLWGPSADTSTTCTIGGTSVGTDTLQFTADPY